MFGRDGLKYANRKMELTNILQLEQQQMARFWEVFGAEVPELVKKLLELKHLRKNYRHKTGVFAVGDSVMLEVHKNAKHEDSYDGLYVIKRITDIGHYILDVDGEEVEAPSNFLKTASSEVPVKQKSLGTDIEENSLQPLDEAGIDNLRDKSYVPERVVPKKRNRRERQKEKKRENSARNERIEKRGRYSKNRNTVVYNSEGERRGTRIRPKNDWYMKDW